MGGQESVPQLDSPYSGVPVSTMCVSVWHIQAMPLSGDAAGDSLSTTQ